MNKSHRSPALSVLLLSVALASLSALAQTTPLELSRGIARSLQPFVESHALAGAVTLVASKDKVLSLEAVGWADIAAKKPMKTDALFWIASMSKPMTTTALMMLVDEGKVNVDDPVEKYLPEFKGQMVVAEKDDSHALLKKPAHPITVRNVLSHTSGLTPRSPLETQIDTLGLRENVWGYPMLPLKFEPGSKYEYSNAGINTAGRIIEVVSGMPYEKFMAERLFQPLGMKDTTFWPNTKQLTRLAKSYKPNQAKDGLEETTINQLTYPLTNPRRGPCPAGGLFSTAKDCAIFCQMILNRGVHAGKRYLSEAAIDQMTCKQTGSLLKGGGYGFGWQTQRKAYGSNDPDTPGWFGHGGAYNTNMQIDPQHRLITIFMVQHAGFANPETKKELLPTFHLAANKAFAAT
jgi:CubicO group peptidase (beta-lactamase class C family)